MKIFEMSKRFERTHHLYLVSCKSLLGVSAVTGEKHLKTFSSLLIAIFSVLNDVVMLGIQNAVLAAFISASFSDSITELLTKISISHTRFHTYGIFFCQQPAVTGKHNPFILIWIDSSFIKQSYVYFTSMRKN